MANDAKQFCFYMPEPQKPHTVLHVPGSHTLYIGPGSCARRHAIHAMQYGQRRDVSFLLLTEVDIISGDYEEIVGDAIEDLLVVLEPSPHIFFLVTFCIDEFLGTDEGYLLSRLATRFPDRQFAMEHIAPVDMDEQEDMKSRFDRYAFIQPQFQREDTVCALGGFVPYDRDCEIYDVLGYCGIVSIRGLYDCETYEDYQALGRSRMALGMRFVPPETQAHFEEDLHIPYHYFPTSYDPSYIYTGYRQIIQMLGGQEPPYLRERREEAMEDARDTARMLRGLPIAVDSSAFITPFAAAHALLDHGFDVRWIFHGRRRMPFDEGYYKDICADRPDVQILYSEGVESAALPSQRDCLAIGADCHALLHTELFADIWHDEGYFGFHGVRRLMALLRKTAGVV